MAQVSILNKIRSILGRIMQRAEIVIRLAVKFFGFLILFRLISNAEMFQGVNPDGLFNSNTVQIVLALMATLLPSRCGVFIALVIVVTNVFASSVLGAILVGLGLVLLYVAAASLFPDEAFLIVLVPVCIHFHWYFAIPIICGMFMGAIAIVPVCIGVLTYGFYGIIPLFMNLKMDGSLDELPKMISEASQTGLNVLLGNNSLPFLMTVFSAIIILTVLIRKLHVNYSRYIALGLGSIFGIIALISGGASGKIATDGFMIRSILVVVVLLLLEILKVPLSYKTAQALEFEDDSYVYKVRMIPKMGDSQQLQDKKESKIQKKEEEKYVQERISAERQQDKFRRQVIREQGFGSGAPIIPQRTYDAPKSNDNMGETRIVEGGIDLSMAPNDVNEHAEEARQYYEDHQGQQGATTVIPAMAAVPVQEEIVEDKTVNVSEMDASQGTIVYGASDDVKPAAAAEKGGQRNVLSDEDEPMDLFQGFDK